jgi:ribosomal protein S21
MKRRGARGGEYKDEEEFNWRYLGLKRQSICRDCQKLQRREHYERHTEQEKKRTAEISKDKREAARRFIYEYLSEHRCVDCGEYDFSVVLSEAEGF